MLSYPIFQSIGNTNEYWYYLNQTAANLVIYPQILDIYCYIENRRRLDDTNGNQYRGILQWGNAAAQELGYNSSSALMAANTNYQQQFAVAEKWIRLLWSKYGKNTSPGYLYLCHFLPVNAKHYADKNYVLRDGNGNQLKRGNETYNKNSGLDANNDGYITVGDIDAIVFNTAKTLGYVNGSVSIPSNTGTTTNILPDIFGLGKYSDILTGGIALVGVAIGIKIFTSAIKY